MRMRQRCVPGRFSSPAKNGLGHGNEATGAMAPWRSPSSVRVWLSLNSCDVMFRSKLTETGKLRVVSATLAALLYDGWRGHVLWKLLHDHEGESVRP